MVNVRRTIPFLLIAVIFTNLFTVLAAADSRKNSIGQLPFDPEFQPIPGTYRYEIYWQKIKVGKVGVTFSKENDFYRIAVSGKTDKKVSYLYKAKYRGEVTIDNSSLQPITAKIDESSRSKKKKITIDFPEPNRIEVTEKQYKKGRLSKEKQKEVISDTFILDPFSTAFLIRQLDWQVGTAEVFDIYSGKKKYELKLSCPDIVSISIDDTMREAFVIIPETTHTKKGKQIRRSSFRIYLSNDSKKEILKIAGKPKIGRIVAKVKDFRPL